MTGAASCSIGRKVGRSVVALSPVSRVVGLAVGDVKAPLPFSSTHRSKRWPVGGIAAMVTRSPGA